MSKSYLSLADGGSALPEPVRVGVCFVLGGLLLYFFPPLWCAVPLIVLQGHGKTS